MYTPRCNGEYARTLKLADRYFYCEDCRDCAWSKQLPDWDNEADYVDTVTKINQAYPYTVKVWTLGETPPVIIQYPTIKDMVEDACSIGRIAGLNNTSQEVEFIEGDDVYADHH